MWYFVFLVSNNIGAICKFDSLGSCNLRVLELDNGSVTNPLLFKTFLVREDLFPVRHIALCGLNVHAGSLLILSEELDFNNGFPIEALNFISLLSSVYGVCFDGESKVLSLVRLLLVIHDVVGLVLVFCEGPLLGQTIIFDVFLDIIPYGAWFDLIKNDIICHNVIEGLLSESCLTDQMQLLGTSTAASNSLGISSRLSSLLCQLGKNIVSNLLMLLA